MKMKKACETLDGSLKKNLIKTRNIIKKKFLKLKKSRMEVNKILEKNLKPLIDPLKAIAANIKKEPSSTIKMEPKTEEEKQEENDDVFDLEAVDRGVKRRRESHDFQFLKKRKSSQPISQQDFDDLGPPFIQTETIAETSPTRLSTEFMQQQYNLPEARDEINTSLSQFESLPKKYLQLIISDTVGLTDNQYGIRFNPDTQEWMIGDSNVEIDGNDIIVKDRKYQGTNGLYQLIFMKNPEDFSQEDLHRYGSILRLTNAHKRGYKPDGQINGNKSVKYRTIIKKLFPIEARRDRFFSVPGSGLHVTSNTTPQYIYWNSINELVDRLRLLYAEKNAGNNSVDNQITSILEELSEEGIIS